jgi:hypothetical protein
MTMVDSRIQAGHTESKLHRITVLERVSAAMMWAQVAAAPGTRYLEQRLTRHRRSEGVPLNRDHHCASTLMV